MDSQSLTTNFLDEFRNMNTNKSNMTPCPAHYSWAAIVMQ